MSLHKQTAIVVTTIFEPTFLDSYTENLRGYSREGEVTIFIIPDRKTPASVYDRQKEACKRGFDVRCPGLGEQERFLRKIGIPDDFIPWDTDNRRNVGYLMALDAGCEILISIDDDNFCLPDDDFVGEHHVVGTQGPLLGVDDSEGIAWFNACTLLESDAPAEIFPRGFPYFARAGEHVGRSGLRKEDTDRHAAIAVNTGLWLGDPDVDAVTRLSLAPGVSGFNGPPVVLGENVWAPINTQNTALTREAAAAYYYVRMGYPLQGLGIDRYGDILSGYFVQKCARHFGHAVRVGTPIAHHRRTPHNLFKDLYCELVGIVLIEELLPWLIDEPLEGDTYPEAYASLAEHLSAASDRFNGFVWDEGGRGFLRETAKLMQVWLEALEQIGI